MGATGAKNSRGHYFETPYTLTVYKAFNWVRFTNLPCQCPYQTYFDIKNVRIMTAIPFFFPLLSNNNVLNPYKYYDMKGSQE